MADEDKPWVKLCRSKYYPVVGFWRARGTGGGSTMWRQVIKMRNFFSPHVKWCLGKGDKIQALSQPWFDNWSAQNEATTADRKLRVSSLIEQQTGDWDVTLLNRLFLPEQVTSILTRVEKPDMDSLHSDRLVWNLTKSGRYSVKEGYKELCLHPQGLTRALTVNWSLIWKWKAIVPKIKVFLWRLLHKGLPVAVNLHSRIAGISPTCQRCGTENEYEMHCMFFCNSSRLVWFGSMLGIRVHELPLDIITTITTVVEWLDEQGVRIFANTLWEIWKERCAVVMENKVFQPQDVLKRVGVSIASRHEGIRRPQAESRAALNERYGFRVNSWQVITDASWDCTNKAGGGFVIYRGGVAKAVGSQFFQAYDPFHSEGIAVLNAILYFYQHYQVGEGETVEVFSDCWNLLQVINQEDTTDLPSWRAIKVVEELIRTVGSRQHQLYITHARREALEQAHNLANLARRTGMSYQGQPDMFELQNLNINRVIDGRFFQRVTDRPP